MEGHWKLADQKPVTAKGEEEYKPRYQVEKKLNTHAVKVFHVARESEVRKRRQTIERNTVVATGIRNLLREVKISEEGVGEGEGKSDIENMLNAPDSEADVVVSQQASWTDHMDQRRTSNSRGHHSLTIEHFDDALHLRTSSKSYSSVADAVTPEVTTPMDAAAPSSIHNIHTYLKGNYYENTMYTTREPFTSRGPTTSTSCLAFPRLCMEFDSNIFSWVQARQVMTTFKIRFRRRIEMVAGICFLATGGSIIGCLATIYSSSNIAAAYSTPLVLQTIVIVTIFAVALMKYIAEAAKINGMFDRQKMSIRKHQLKIHSMIAHCQTILNAPDIRAKLEVRNNALEACALFIETANHNEPCEVFGIKAEAGLILTIFSGLISFYITLISIYYYNGVKK